jgi:hypothetical protein
MKTPRSWERNWFTGSESTLVDTAVAVPLSDSGFKFIVAHGILRLRLVEFQMRFL